MAKQQQKRKTQRPTNHAYRGCRDIVLSNSGTGSPGTTTVQLGFNSSGTASFVGAFAPLGLGGAPLTANAAVLGPPVIGNIASPLLRGLWNKSQDFQMYRVTRAKCVFVANTGSTTSGQLIMAGYTDPLDVSNLTQNAYVSSTESARTFNLASASTKELSVSIPVDTSWKKVTGFVTVTGSTAPFTGGSSMLIPVNSVNDLCFGAVSVLVQGGPASGSAGTLYIDYDVEFKGLIDTSVNL